MSDIEPSRVLSIQSHVVSGYVGNRAAVFPLQLLGFEVDFINSVQFSNHTGYPTFTGKSQVLDGDGLLDLTTGLLNNGLTDDYSYILTGYIGSESFLDSVLLSLEKIKTTTNNKVLYICDPVLGDNDHYYVPKELVSVYRERVIPQAYMITPNQFEAELLTEMKIKNFEDAVFVMKKLLSKGPQVVILTSCEIEEYPDQLCCMSLCSSTSGSTSGSDECELNYVIVPKQKGRFTGTGDVLAALLIGIGHLHKFEMNTTLSKAISTIASVISKTSDKQKLIKLNDGYNGDGSGIDINDSHTITAIASEMKKSELSLIQCRNIIIESPVVEAKYQAVTKTVYVGGDETPRWK